MKVFVMTAVLVALAAPAFAGDMPQPMNASDIKWGPVPPVIPAGAQLAVVSGDPSKEGQPYTIRLKMPDGYKVPPHFHPADEAATVISGSFNLGMGDKLDTSQTMELQPGGFAYAPAGMHHYAWAKGETVVQINGNGPFGITYVNPEDDPSKGMASKK
jgi:quercetin dioxygenase-like cupin family protein